MSQVYKIAFISDFLSLFKKFLESLETFDSDRESVWYPKTNQLLRMRSLGSGKLHTPKAVAQTRDEFSPKFSRILSSSPSPSERRRLMITFCER